MTARPSVLAMLGCLCAAGVAHADDTPTTPAIATYAIVVGSNSGGPGQTELRFAEDDARRVAAILTELGGYRKDQVDIVTHPSPEQLRSELAKVGERVQADLAAGKQARVFFYYSGHARSQAIDLGGDELPLPELRERLFELKATLTVVVLDACQSGAFSRVKGAAPTADFSFSSRQHLDATGVAVLASSSGSELSQESEQLRSSYFTHHLLVGLRGAGDANGDGQVSIDEAYRYAYHQTLLATAETAVGGQHVTFEADLKGHGEVPLSFPRAATATITLPAKIEGKTLVEDKRAHAVVAETYKAAGAPVRIAVAPGEYQVIVRHGSSLSRCDLVAPGAVDLEQCRTEAIVATIAKGGEIWGDSDSLEVGYMLGNERHDGYTDSLKAFGYQEDDFLAMDAGLQARYLRRVNDRIRVGVGGSYFMMPKWSYTVTGSDLTQELDWSTGALTAVVRGEQPMSDAGLSHNISVYAQLDVGLGIGHTSLHAADNMTYSDFHFGPAFSASGGLHIGSRRVHGVGGNVAYEYDYWPVIGDLIGNTHASGGHRVTSSLTFNF